MNRTDFLQMCQKISVLKNGICNVIENVPDELKIIYNGIEYYPIAYELSFKKGKPMHKAILHDLKANSVTYTDLERIDKYERE